MFGISFALMFLIPALFIGLLPNFTSNYSDQRLLLCVTTWLVCVVVLARLVFIRSDNKQLYAIFWTSPLLLVFLSGELYPTPYRVEPLMYVFFFGGAALMGGSLAQSANLSRHANSLLFAVAGACLLYGLVALMTYSFALLDGRTEVDEFLTWGFPNIRYWSHLATWLIPILAAAHCRASGVSWPLFRYLVIAAGGLWWWMLFSTVGRGSVIGLVFAILFALVLFRRSALGLVKAVSLHALAGSLLWLGLTVLVPWAFLGSPELRPMDAGSSGRMPMWLEAWQMSLVNFPFGMGPQSWLTHETITEAYREARFFGHPHNMYLMWAAEYGWVSIAALIWLVVGVSRKLVTKRQAWVQSNSDAPVFIALTMSCVAAGVHAGVSAVFMAPASMLGGFLIMTFFWAGVVRESCEPTEPQAIRSRPRSVQLATAVFLALVLGGGGVWLSEVWRYYEDNMEDRLTYKGEGTIYSPRFWSHGDFPRQ